MLIREALQWASQGLSTQAENESPALDASILLSWVLSTTREVLYARLSEELSPESKKRFKETIEKRMLGFPVAYITGRKEFFGREFKVFQGVLCPRPDTEILVEEALKRVPPGTALLDLCTGTGCIGLTMEAEAGHILTAADISPQAEGCFKANRESLLSQATFLRSDLFASIKGSFQAILTNPPYLTRLETEDRRTRGWQEPALALDGGVEGLDLIRQIVREAPDYLQKGGWLMIEADPRQMSTIADLMIERGFRNVEIIPDLAENDRVALGDWNG